MVSGTASARSLDGGATMTSSTVSDAGAAGNGCDTSGHASAATSPTWTATEQTSAAHVALARGVVHGRTGHPGLAAARARAWKSLSMPLRSAFSRGAFSGDPASNGGCGSYSDNSCIARA